MSCSAARERIPSDGYRNIVARDCRGSSYIFSATRHRRAVVLHFNARNGHLSRA